MRKEKNINVNIPIIIPAYEPDEKLLELLEKLKEYSLENIVIVNDGSGEKYKSFFQTAKMKYNCVILEHGENKGKGRALKTAFEYCLENDSDLVGCITADSDGQHTPEDIERCMNALVEHVDMLILGTRDFDGENIPAKSRFGNKLTRCICKYLCGLSIADTQTGLRGIPKEFMQKLLSVEGERFEFETNMLIESKDKYPIYEVKIETVYDSKENHSTHFDPIKDSIKIYKIFGKIFFRFIMSSLSSCVLDIALFSVFIFLLKNRIGEYYILVSTIIARVFSATYNYLINYKMVFSSKQKHGRSAGRYILLATVQMLASGILVSACSKVQVIPEVFWKIVIDTILFLISFIVQRELVFK